MEDGNDNGKKRRKKNDSYKNKCNDDKKNNKKNEDTLGLASLSYVDFIILASTLAYSLSEELGETDLALLITFFYLVLADLQVLVAQNGIKKATSNEDETVDTEDELDVELITPTSRHNKKRRYKGKKKHR